MTADPHPAVAVLAEALDQLGARIHRDLHTDSSYINIDEDNPLYPVLNAFSGFAEECLTALDHPAVREALDIAHRERGA
jgi:hypothetical protein